MKLKKLAFILLFSLFCFASFAEDSYKLSIISANSMSVSEDLVTLEGGVEVSFNTKEDNKVRKLSADKVIIDVESKSLDALGSVYMTEGEDSTFQGDSVSLNWDTLDVVVFGGTSSSDRPNSAGKDVKFFIVGDRISYSGENDSVFFQDGVIATREKDPYWSVAAKKIGLAGSDIFFYNATLKLGRVPILWIPFFFYPGNRLSFNPALGFSSSKGMFINTTYELYGRYPKLGSSSSSSSSSSDDASALASNFLNFLDSGEDSDQIRSGWTYISVEDAGELSDLQKWALDTGSYFAVFADAWEQYGLSIGYDTTNYLFNKKLQLSSVGVFAFQNKNVRYSFDLNGSYSLNKVKFSFEIPFRSDPSVKSDLLNRNTVFGLDSAFGATQSFPSTYSSSERKYSMFLDGSASYSFKKISLDLSSLKAKINYEWNSKLKKYEIDDANLPYVNFKSSGTLVDWSGKSTSTEVQTKLSNKTAQKFYDEYNNISSSDDVVESPIVGSLSLYKGSAVSTKKTVSSDAASIKLGYTFNQTLDNSYSENFDKSSFIGKLDATIDSSGKVPGNWFNFSESLNPNFYLNSSNTDDATTFKLKNKTTLGISKLGLQYGLTNYVYIFDKNKTETVDRWGKFDKTDVLEHYANLSKQISYFKLGVKYVLPPLDQTLTPSVSYSKNKLSASADVSLSLNDSTMFKPVLAHASASYSINNISTSVSSTFDLKKQNKWDGFSASETISATYLESRVKLDQSLTLKNHFDVNELSFKAAFDKNYISFSMKDNSLSPDKLNIYLYQGVPAFYVWKDRIGFEGDFDFGFTYDFVNKYNTSLYADVKFNFAVNKFFDLALSVKSVNNSFYRYYSDDDKFDFGILWKDFVNSFDFFNGGRRKTGFNLSSFSVSAVHYMEDWTLTLTSSSQIKTVNGKYQFVPDFTFLVKWNAIPELKSTNTWDSVNNWEKE